MSDPIRKFERNPLPNDNAEAISCVSTVLGVDTDALRSMSREEFIRAWYAIGFLFPGLHPDDASNHGDELVIVPELDSEPGLIDARLLSTHFVESGWPEVLVPFVEEAWRRFDDGEIQEHEFYCVDAVVAGIHHRNSKTI